MNVDHSRIQRTIDWWLFGTFWLYRWQDTDPEYGCGKAWKA